MGMTEPFFLNTIGISLCEFLEVIIKFRQCVSNCQSAHSRGALIFAELGVIVKAVGTKVSHVSVREAIPSRSSFQTPFPSSLSEGGRGSKPSPPPVLYRPPR